MEGIEPIPIESSGEAQGIEDGSLVDDSPLRMGFDFILEPGATGQFHFRPEAKESILLIGFNPKEINYVPGVQIVRVAARP
jgi:hypothetical protein